MIKLLLTVRRALLAIKVSGDTSVSEHFGHVKSFSNKYSLIPDKLRVHTHTSQSVIYIHHKSSLHSIE